MSSSFSSATQTRSGRGRRSRGQLRKHTNVDGVLVEEPFKFTLPPLLKGDGNSLYKESNNIAGEEGSNSQSGGDGCFVSSLINNRRYYGVLVDQVSLQKASELHFLNEASSIDTNRRMKVLYDEKEQKKKQQKQNKRAIPQSGNEKKGTSNPEIVLLDDDEDDDDAESNMTSNKKQKTSMHSSQKTQTSSTLSSSRQTQNKEVTTERQGEDQDYQQRLLNYHDNRQVQKLLYLPAPTNRAGAPTGPGTRRLVATYMNVIAASEGCAKREKDILQACQSGGDFIGNYYYQYHHDESTLLMNQQAATPEATLGGFRTSVSLNDFLQCTPMPPWYPLSNVKIDQSKLLNLLQLKRNNKGGIEWDDEQLGNMDVGLTNLGPPRLPMTPRNKFRVGVLGGGIAGIACASELLRLSREVESVEVEVILLEGRTRVGGRLFTDYETFQSADGNSFPVDLGASWIHGIDKNPIAELAKEANVEFLRSSEEVKMLTSGKEVDKECDNNMGKLFDTFLDKAADKSWTSPEFEYENRNQKAVRWYASNLREEEGELMPVATDVAECRHSSDISVDLAIGTSLDWGKHYLKSQDNKLLLWNSKNTEYAMGANMKDLSMRFWDADEKHALSGDHVLLRQGYTQVVQYLFNRCKQDPFFKCLLGFPVGLVEYARKTMTKPYPKSQERQSQTIELSDTCRVHSRDASQSHTFDFVVSALPLGVLKESKDLSSSPSANLNGADEANKKNLESKTLLFNPPLPQVKRDAIDSVGFGLLNKVYIQFRKPFWRKKGNREFLRSTPYLGDEQEIFGNASGRNNHHYMFLDIGRSAYGDDPRCPHILMSLISGIEAVAYELKNDKTLLKEVVATLKYLFPDEEDKTVFEPIAFKRTTWGTDEFSRGSYTFLPPGATDHDYQILQAPINEKGDAFSGLTSSNDSSDVMRLFFAGEHTSTMYPSMSHGAMLSGVRAAREVMSAINNVSASASFKKTIGGVKIDQQIPVTTYRMKFGNNSPSAGGGVPRCGLCPNPGTRKKEGAMCAFVRGKQHVLVHHNCAFYSPEVGSTADGQWTNVIKAVNRGKSIRCAHCGKMGATIGCIHQNCNKSFHFSCCVDTGWLFLRRGGANGKEYLCDKHREHTQEEVPISIEYYKKKRPRSERTLKCHICNDSSEDTETLGKLLAFAKADNMALVHRNCARYSTDVVFKEDHHIYQNIFESIYRAGYCMKCSKIGATVKCSKEGCSNAYHVKCACEGSKDNGSGGWNFELAKKRNEEFVCEYHRVKSKSIGESDIAPIDLTDGDGEQGGENTTTRMSASASSATTAALSTEGMGSTATAGGDAMEIDTSANDSSGGSFTLPQHALFL